jgi:hypothetical protein
MMGPMRTCSVCEQLFTSKRKNATVCSRTCHNRKRRAVWRKRKRARIKAGKQTPKPCEKCGKEFVPSKVQQAYCSPKCRPSRSPRFTNWTSSCEVCAKPFSREDHRAQGHQHHILPVHMGGANVAGNLALVCPRCHFAIHKSALFQYVGPRDRDAFIFVCQNILEVGK